VQQIISRIILVGLLIAAAAIVILVEPRGVAQVEPGFVKVVYWEKWTSDEAAQMGQIVKDFNDTVGKEKKIHVEYLSISRVDQKTLVAAAAGVPPDVAGLWDGQLVQFAALNALEPLEDLAAAHGITDGYYKDVYWKACNWNGHLWALISTPAAAALHWDKSIFRQEADKLRAAGLDPDQPPKTIDELDRYAEVLNTRDAAGRIDRAGYLPLEPGWFLNYTSYWFGGSIFDEKTGKFTLTDPAVVRAYEWIESYSRKLGKGAITDFRSGLGQFSSSQNGFFVGKVAMEQQGPWMANFINVYAPHMTQLKVPREQELSLPQRRDNYGWAAAAFPSAVPGLEDVTYAGFDTLVIPKGARHPREAFEFIAYVNRQDVIEKLNKLHCKNSPLAKVSDGFVATHPNPYIEVFERLSASPNARSMPQIPIWPEVSAEMDVMNQNITLLTGDELDPPKRPADWLAEVQTKVQGKYDDYLARQRARGVELAAPMK
jgi:multiple sugar transport system substrate-binding protein